MKRPPSGTLIGVVFILIIVVSALMSLIQPVKTVPKPGIAVPPASSP